MKNFYKLERHSWASTASEKFLRPPGTPGAFNRSSKYIYKFDRHSGGSKTYEKCLGAPGSPRIF